MAYADHWRLTVGGTLGTDSPPAEEWSCTLNFAYGDGVMAQTNLDLAYDNWADFITGGFFCSFVKLTFAKIAHVDSTGHVSGAVLRHDEITAGVASANILPFQTAFVVSLVTGERGISKRGRIYLPPMNLVIRAQDGLISEIDRDAVQTDAAELMTALESSLGATHGLVVASQKGYSTPVTGVRVGRVPDTQRRRRRSLDESYDPATPI